MIYSTLEMENLLLQKMKKEDDTLESVHIENEAYARNGEIQSVCISMQYNGDIRGCSHLKIIDLVRYLDNQPVSILYDEEGVLYFGTEEDYYTETEILENPNQITGNLEVITCEDWKKEYLNYLQETFPSSSIASVDILCQVITSGFITGLRMKEKSIDGICWNVDITPANVLYFAYHYYPKDIIDDWNNHAYFDKDGDIHFDNGFTRCSTKNLHSTSESCCN